MTETYAVVHMTVPRWRSPVNGAIRFVTTSNGISLPLKTFSHSKSPLRMPLMKGKSVERQLQMSINHLMAMNRHLLFPHLSPEQREGTFSAGDFFKVIILKRGKVFYPLKAFSASHDR